MVVGCAGAGKSTFARRLADVTGLPLVHLDQHYWRPGWVEPDEEEWSTRVASLVAEPNWIMDGNYRRTLSILAQKRKPGAGPGFPNSAIAR